MLSGEVFLLSSHLLSFLSLSPDLPLPLLSPFSLLVPRMPFRGKTDLFRNTLSSAKSPATAPASLSTLLGGAWSFFAVSCPKRATSTCDSSYLRMLPWFPFEGDYAGEDDLS